MGDPSDSIISGPSADSAPARPPASILVAAAVVIGLPNVGVVLISALLIMPGASARFWTDRLGSLLVFDYIYIITQGGPAGASEVVGTLMYKEAFARFEAGYAAALGLGMSFMSGLIVLIFISLRRRGWEV